MAAVSYPRKRLWTRAEYHRAAEVGLFRPEERLELLEGELIYKMSPQSNPHATGIGLAADALRDAFGSNFHIREEKPMILSDLSEPEPDVAVVRGKRRGRLQHPTPEEVALVLEVSESTLAFDRREKAVAYARSGVAEYWILNLPQRRLEVHRDPGETGPGEWGYRTLHIVTEAEQVTPLSLPETRISVAEMLPSPLTGEATALPAEAPETG